MGYTPLCSRIGGKVMTMSSNTPAIEARIAERYCTGCGRNLLHCGDFIAASRIDKCATCWQRGVVQLDNLMGKTVTIYIMAGSPSNIIYAYGVLDKSYSNTKIGWLAVDGQGHGYVSFSKHQLVGLILRPNDKPEASQATIYIKL